MLLERHEAVVPSFHEARAWPRKRMFKTGRVILHNQSTIDCVIRDLSIGGARLVFDSAMTLEPSFDLHFATTQTVIPAEVVWQRGFAVGVKFTGGQRPAEFARH